MSNLRILYIRKDSNCDDKIIRLIDRLSGDIKLVLKNENYIVEEDFISSDFHVIIFQGRLPERFYDLKIKPTLVIEIDDEKAGAEEFLYFSGSILEKISQNCLEKDLENLKVLLEKHQAIISRQTIDQQLIKHLFELIPNGVLLFDLKGNIKEVNSFLTNFKASELVNKSIYEYVLPEEKQRVEKAVEEIKKVDFISMELQLLTKSGKYIPVQTNSRLLKDQKGNPCFILSIITDISVQKKAWEKERYLETIINASSDGIVATDQNHKVTIWNKGAERIFGFSKEKILGTEIFNFAIDPEKRAIMEDIFKNRLPKEEAITDLIIDSISKRGNIKIELSLSVMRDKNNNFAGCIATIRDVSPVHKFLQEAQKKNEEMEHLINVVSHDLRSPIHSLDAYLTAIQEMTREEITDEEILEMFERMHANLSNMESLIQDLTDFTRVGLTKEDILAVDLNSIVEDIVNDIQWQVGKQNFKLEMEKLPTLRITPGRIYQVFENLLNNAYKFRKEGEQAKTKISYEENENEIIIHVKDFGIGIDSKHHEKIFNLFFRLGQKKVKGTGAGLAITRKIINNYKGKIWVESEGGAGSTFTFTLPRSMKAKTD